MTRPATPPRSPSPYNPTSGLTCVYDAWNRLVSATDGTNAMTYQYDGTGRLTERIVGQHDPSDDYYSGQQAIQVVHRTRRPATYSRAASSTSGRRFTSTRPSFATVTTPTAVLIGCRELYYTTDANHNVTAVTELLRRGSDRYPTWPMAR